MMRQTLYAITTLFALAINGIALSSFTTASAAEVGKCGIYADSYHGKPTSSGEKYNKDALTCSHKTLAFGTKIRVTRLDNKKSVVVRVNDRGPFLEGFIVDISSAAAREIDLKTGSTQVKIELVESAESATASDAETESEVQKSAQTAPAKTTDAVAKPVTNGVSTSVNTSPKGVAAATPAQDAPKVAPSSNLYKVDIAETEKSGFGVQVTSLSDANNVLPFMRELQTKFPGKVLVNVVRDEFNNPTYKVIIGQFADKKSADEAQKKIAQKYKKTMVVDLGGM